MWDTSHYRHYRQAGGGGGDMMQRMKAELRCEKCSYLLSPVSYILPPVFCLRVRSPPGSLKTAAFLPDFSFFAVTMKLHQFSSWIVLYCRMFYLRGVRFIFNEHYLVLKSISLNSRFDNLPSLLSSLRSNTASIWSGSVLLFYVTSYSRPTCDLVSLVVELSISFLVM